LAEFWLIEPLIEPGAGVVLPVLPDVPLPSVDALLVAVGDGAVAALLPMEPLLPVEPLLFFMSLPDEPPVEELPMLLPPVDELPMEPLLPVVPLPVVLVPMLPLPFAALPMLPPVELLPGAPPTVEPPVDPLPVVLDVGPVLLPGMFLLVSTMMISF
jgi:hypothetical protein